MSERAVDPIVFGPHYITRYDAAALGIGLMCPGCKRYPRRDEHWGFINYEAFCGDCCDAEEERRS
ncbi:hypothetical protein [Streptomyces sp. NPDC059009]|uniref:hypothetical protein n=1 Tax=Streptomyces sp. NPDC059009 TaxID=3346694 RepID=UPI0036C23F21